MELAHSPLGNHVDPVSTLYLRAFIRGQHSMEIKSSGLNSHCLLAVQLWINILTSLYLSFLTHEVDVMMTHD